MRGQSRRNLENRRTATRILKHGQPLVALLIVLAAVSSVSGLQGTPAPVADRENRQDHIDRITYGSERFSKYREITYWGIASLTVSDYKYGSGDVSRSGLVRKESGGPLPREYPSTRLQQHFMREFRRLFADLPFHDLDDGRDARWGQFYKEHEREFAKAGNDLREKWKALEEARRQSLYGGRAGAIYCSVAVKRASFPILYEMQCSMSAEDDLRPHIVGSDDFEKDIGFSSPDHIAGEIEKGLSAMLAKLSSALAKMRKYGPPSR